MIILLIIICQSFILRSNKIYACLSLQLLPLLEFRLTGQLHAQFTEGKYIHRRQHNRSMCLAAFQLWKLLQGKTCFWIRSSTDGKGNHGLIHMKTRILTSKIICFQLLNRVNSIRGDHMLLVINSCKLFQHIQKKGRGCTKQRSYL